MKYKTTSYKDNKTKALLAGLTLGALVIATRPDLQANVYAAANKYEWEKQEDIDLLGGYYSSAASSADGTHLIVGVGDGGEGIGLASPLYISGNSGETWENVAPEIDPETRNRWTSVDVSNNGQVMVAASDWGIDIDTTDSRDGKIFVSEDGGDSWANITPAGVTEWEEVVVSGDGQKILAIDDDDYELHMTTNGGDSWTTPDVTDIYNLHSLSVSDDGGTILIGGENTNDYSTSLMISEDSGSSWTNISPDSDNWIDVTRQDISADGTKIIAANEFYDGDYFSKIFVSDDSGENWAEVTIDVNIQEWQDAAISDDGSMLSVMNNDGLMYLSDDFGDNWTEEDPGQSYEDSNYWIDGDFNSDGSQMLVAGEDNVYLTLSSIEDNNDTPVVNFGNAEDGKTVVLTLPSGTTVTCQSAVKESGLTTQDAGYNYPVGLVDFCFDTTEESNQITLTFVTDLKPNQVVVRKYNPNTGAYSSVAGATVTETTYNSQAALNVTYTIVDNGELDLDPDLGEISDPVGIANAAVGSPNTGIASVRQLLFIDNK